VRFELFLAGRFFRKRVINMLAVFVVAFAVLTPIVVLAVMTGFAEYMEEQIRGALSDVVVGEPGFDAVVRAPRALCDRIASLPGVAGAAPFIKSFVVAKNPRWRETTAEPALLAGFDAPYEYRVFRRRGKRADLATFFFADTYGPALKAFRKLVEEYDIPTWCVDVADTEQGKKAKIARFFRLVEKNAGKEARRRLEHEAASRRLSWENIKDVVTDLYWNYADTIRYTPSTLFARPEEEGFEEVAYPPAFVNTDLALRLGLSPGDTFLVVTMTRGGKPVKRKFRMKGGLRPYSAAKGDKFDMPAVVVPYEEAELLFDTGGKASGVSVWLADGVDLREGKERVAGVTSYPCYTWKDLRENVLRAVENENRLLRVVLLCIGIAGGFAILAVIYTSVSEKTRDIGILKAVGIRPGKIVAVFMLQAVAIGVLGASLGVVLAYLVVDNINWLSEVVGWTPFSGDIYYLPPGGNLPVSWEHAGVWFFAVSSFLICCAAGLYPSLRAAALNAVEAIRNE